ncbi:M14 family metallopeptidase [Enterococcus sp. LJL99]
MENKLGIYLEQRSYFIDKLAVELSYIIGFSTSIMEFPILFYSEKNAKQLMIYLKEGQRFEVLQQKNCLLVTFVASERGLQECCWYFVQNIPSYQKTNEKARQLKDANPFVSATASAPEDQTFSTEKATGLAAFFELGAVLQDKNHDFLPDYIEGTILFDEKWTDEQLIAASNLAARLGMEVTTLHYPIVSIDKMRMYQFVFLSSETECSFSQNDTTYQFKGEGANLLRLSKIICQSFPTLAEGCTWSDYLEKLSDSLAMKNLDGELAWLDASAKKSDTVVKAQLSPRYRELSEKLTERYPAVTFCGYKDQKQVYQKTYQRTWEVDRFYELVKQQYFLASKPGDHIELVGAISEDLAQRNQLFTWLEQQAVAYQVTIKVTLCSTYKEGFSWIKDVLVPKLKQQKIHSIEIGFRPFLPTGETVWLDEDGSVPTYSLIREDNPEKWLDLPIRFLQELYPIDDILATELSIPRENITFYALENAEKYTYRVTALDENCVSLSEETWEVLTNERPYLDDYLDQGVVHPNTSWIKGKINGKEVLHETFLSDLETVWSVYQTEILPEVKQYCLNKLTGSIAANEQPLFAQLKIEVFISEPDEKLASRQDLYSALDALQEDFYFVGLDYFRLFGQEYGGIPVDAPGLILPIIHKTSGPPKIIVTLFEQQGQRSQIVTETTTLRPKTDLPKVMLEKLAIIDNEIEAVISIEDSPAHQEVCAAYCQLFEAGLLSVQDLFQSVDKVKFSVGTKTYELRLPKKALAESYLKITEIDLLEDQLIGYEEYCQIIAQLAKIPELTVYPIGETYQGRVIHAIELQPKAAGYLSKVKRINHYPSEIINARHHANEVSGTNGVFLLLKELLTNSKYQSVAEQMNLVMIPFENADGAALHYELQKEHPEWKFHVARFNALGRDFYYEYFQPETIHTEALGFSKIWRKWLPDVIVDNHGVPSHEWEQPFSGYTPPAFKGFWLPRALLYGYFWLINDARFSENVSMNQHLEVAIANRIKENQTMTKENLEWQDRFEKYAHQWLPKLFPADYYKNMINYKISFEYDKKHRYPSIRFPWITSVCYTSEVTDETAVGSLLNLCGAVHKVHELAVIDQLLTARYYINNERKVGEGTFYFDQTRQRPLILKEQSSSDQD